jgi:hypothetical protein
MPVLAQKELSTGLSTTEIGVWKSFVKLYMRIAAEMLQMFLTFSVCRIPQNSTMVAIADV